MFARRATPELVEGRERVKELFVDAVVADMRLHREEKPSGKTQ
jgi:hypothetical protein